jgi:hypothetical protein
MGLIVLGILLAVAGLATVPTKMALGFLDVQRSGRMMFYCGFLLALLGALEELLTPG